MSTRRNDTTAAGMAFERPIKEIESQLSELEAISQRTNLDISSELEALRRRLSEAIDTTYADLTPWERVNVARHTDRPVASDYVEKILDEFIELHGDKVFADDKAIVTGLARIEDQRFMMIAHRKGRTTKERVAYNFGCAHPEGYRKALRKMRLAEKLHLPIVTLINTPGAYPGIGAEERGQATAIAENILQMFSIKVPIVVIVIGEGGSGGALGIGIGDRVFMMEHSYYSVISPEGCAAILWKDGERTPDAAEALKLTAPDLVKLGLIDGVIQEPQGGAHRAPLTAMAQVKKTIQTALRELEAIPIERLLHERRQKFRRAGEIPGRFPIIT
ncbi:MAG: acetyl-CoA carboxylase carboxyltransferase subunit alpha [Planctomycetota bacterium]|nr:acetyl-CoA carboxylase carboxyltransferase subunit alpha [Planctomycetota bacterium]